MFKSLNRYRMYKKTYDELNRMSNRDLNDLGISRCDIKKFAREALES